MEVAALRETLRRIVLRVGKASTHDKLPRLCKHLGLPSPPSEGSKEEKTHDSFDALNEDEYLDVAKRLLESQPLTAGERIALEDLVWDSEPCPELPKKVRREIARVLNIQDLFISVEGFQRLLDSLWILDDDPIDALFDGTRNLRSRIERHVYRNPGDWTVEELFAELQAFEASHGRFARFLEGLVGCDVLTDESAQRQFVASVNPILRGCGAELRETGIEDGYPAFRIVSTQAGRNRSPKNVIFASSVKPDIRFRSAVDNDIEIVGNADKVLVYDRPIGPDGLRWRDLQKWWAAVNDIADNDSAKQMLYRRLLESLPTNSPPQMTLFKGFYKGFGSLIPDLPALLPEVWLHWDPKTVRERGPDALLRFRMDFLLLLPHGTRIVVEVDGKQHYANDEGVADPSRYASLVAADRELKLSGYEVFRFGGGELPNEQSFSLVKDFFVALFEKYCVPVPGARLPAG